MNRPLLAAACLLVLATPLLAVTGTPAGKRPMRVGVLRTADTWQGDFDVAAVAIERELSAQLRAAGVDAWDTNRTLEGVRDDGVHDADFFVEISGGDAHQRQIGDVGVADEHVVATLGVVISRVAAEVRVYDGHTLELVDHYDLSHHKTVVVPTSIGFGTRDLFAQAALPFIRHMQFKAAIREVAEDAAHRIAAR
jgi:hypothetical protein